MIVSTTDTLQGHAITEYLGIVTGETISGANFLRDIMATITDYVGGRSGAYEDILEKARQSTLNEIEDRARRLGADAIIGVSFDYETIGGRGAMLMVTAIGTAVKTARAI
ncbi:MAG: YbjQ family protein [Hyphomicrobiaceae bacterium]|nr:YbjQ family protein [Hyphomicrobiaceae bacterium]MCC0023140.1 YbjQ family protein [Hyphomicrobiaceae bacterium]